MLHFCTLLAFLHPVITKNSFSLSPKNHKSICWFTLVKSTIWIANHSLWWTKLVHRITICDPLTNQSGFGVGSFSSLARQTSSQGKGNLSCTSAVKIISELRRHLNSFEMKIKNLDYKCLRARICIFPLQKTIMPIDSANIKNNI